MTTLNDIEQQIDAVIIADAPGAAARKYMSLAEEVLEFWVLAHDQQPTEEKKEGFRLLALHRQGAKGEPSFNACRETCRELAYRYNVVQSDMPEKERIAAAEMMTHLARHIYFFVSGKLQVEGLGDFCCSAKPLRTSTAELRDEEI